jgi:hypothetical protein
MMFVAIPGFYFRDNFVEVGWREPVRYATQVYALNKSGLRRFKMMDANPPDAPLHVRRTHPVKLTSGDGK